MVCDICDAPGKGTIVSASNFKKAVRNGFNPIRLRLMSHSIWTYDLWKDHALNGSASYTDWNICSNCQSKLEPYLTSAVTTKSKKGSNTSIKHTNHSGKNIKPVDSILVCQGCSEIYNFKKFAGMMTDEKMSSIFLSSGIPVIGQRTERGHDLVANASGIINKIRRFLGDNKGVPKEVKYCFKIGDIRTWQCDKCKNISNYPNTFINYWKDK
jgi:hypothetical protein